MKSTYTHTLMCQMLAGLNGVDTDSIKQSNWTARGAECVFEFNGEFYKVIVENIPAAVAA